MNALRKLLRKPSEQTASAQPCNDAGGLKVKGMSSLASLTLMKVESKAASIVKGNFKFPKDPKRVIAYIHKDIPTNRPNATDDTSEVRYWLWRVLTTENFECASLYPQWVLETCFNWEGSGQDLVDFQPSFDRVCPPNASYFDANLRRSKIEYFAPHAARIAIGRAIEAVLNHTPAYTTDEGIFDCVGSASSTDEDLPAQLAPVEDLRRSSGCNAIRSIAEPSLSRKTHVDANMSSDSISRSLGRKEGTPSSTRPVRVHFDDLNLERNMRHSVSKARNSPGLPARTFDLDESTRKRNPFSRLSMKLPQVDSKRGRSKASNLVRTPIADAMMRASRNSSDCITTVKVNEHQLDRVPRSRSLKGASKTSYHGNGLVDVSENGYHRQITCTQHPSGAGNGSRPPMKLECESDEGDLIGRRRYPNHAHRLLQQDHNEPLGGSSSTRIFTRSTPNLLSMSPLNTASFQMPSLNTFCPANTKATRAHASVSQQTSRPITTARQPDHLFENIPALVNDVTTAETHHRSRVATEHPMQTFAPLSRSAYYAFESIVDAVNVRQSQALAHETHLAGQAAYGFNSRQVPDHERGTRPWISANDYFSMPPNRDQGLSSPALHSVPSQSPMTTQMTRTKSHGKKVLRESLPNELRNSSSDPQCLSVPRVVRNTAADDFARAQAANIRYSTQRRKELHELRNADSVRPTHIRRHSIETIEARRSSANLTLPCLVEIIEERQLLDGRRQRGLGELR